MPSLRAICILVYLSVALHGQCAASQQLPSDAEVVQDAQELLPWLQAIRRHLHLTPELMYEEHKTSAYIRSTLDELHVPYRYPVATTGIVAEIGAGRPVVALRADMDGLPVQEDSSREVGVVSQHEGRMHACGHDAHTTMLLGAAALLKKHEASLPGTVRLLFQPAEEGGAGAKAMLDDAALDGVTAAYGLHVWPDLQSGRIGTRAGAIMAGSWSFRATISGRGGHAAIPQRAADPVIAAANIVASLQTVVSRTTSALDSIVLSVTRIQGGTAFNVIPDTVIFEGTMRALDSHNAEAAQRRAAEIVSAGATAFGCNGTIDFCVRKHPYPPLLNDASAAETVRRVTERALGRHDFELLAEPSMAGEDFAFFARSVPSAFVFLGIRNETLGSVHPLHNPRFLVDDSVLPRGSALHTLLALEALHKR